MRIIEQESQLDQIPKGSVLTIGNFDGVHAGHRKIITAAKAAACDRAVVAAAMTFEPHPASVLAGKPVAVLTPFEQKVHLLTNLGIDWLVVLKSSPAILRLSAEQFVDRYLVNGIAPMVVVEGEDFNFGAGRSGSIETLRQLGRSEGFDVLVVEAAEVSLSGPSTARVSSTLIRTQLGQGDVRSAAVCLGRAYRLIGQVVRGRGKGKELGFPTANLVCGAQIVPGEGVYAGKVVIGADRRQAIVSGQVHDAALSIGRAETLGPADAAVVEAHLLGEDIGELSGKWLGLDFVQRLRGQRKFATEAELAEQIARDCEQAKGILARKE